MEIPLSIGPSNIIARVHFLTADHWEYVAGITNIKLREFPLERPVLEIQEAKFGIQKYQFRSLTKRYGSNFDIDIVLMNTDIIIMKLIGCVLEETKLDISIDDSLLKAVYNISITDIVEPDQGENT